MRGRGRILSPAELALWRRVAGTAAPLPGKVLPPEPLAEEPEPQKVEKSLDSGSALRAVRNDGPKKKPGPLADRGGEKRIKRGRVEIAARLDLHGLTQDRARIVLADFLARMREEGAGAVLVITGKGGRAGPNQQKTGEGALKANLPFWLAGAEIRPMVSGYSEAHARHGGGGAYYVFLKRS